MTPVSLSLSRKIAQLAKDKGIDLPGSYFVYNLYQGDALLCQRENALEMDEHVNAYTADEIADMLPDVVDGEYYLVLTKDNGTWMASYDNEGSPAVAEDREELFYAREYQWSENSEVSLAEALALLLIWLLKQGYMEEK